MPAVPFFAFLVTPPAALPVAPAALFLGPGLRPAPAPAPAAAAGLALVLRRFWTGAVSGTEKTRGRELPVCERVPSRTMMKLVVMGGVDVWVSGVGGALAPGRT